MDWTSFFFGALAGCTLICGLFGTLGWIWVRPFMRAAQKRASGAGSITPPVMWGSAEQAASSTGNDPLYVWPQAKPKGSEDGDPSS